MKNWERLKEVEEIEGDERGLRRGKRQEEMEEVGGGLRRFEEIERSLKELERDG